MHEIYSDAIDILLIRDNIISLSYKIGATNKAIYAGVSR